MRGRPRTSELPKTQRIVCDALGTGAKSLKRKNAGLIGSGGGCRKVERAKVTAQLLRSEIIKEDIFRLHPPNN